LVALAASGYDEPGVQEILTQDTVYSYDARHRLTGLTQQLCVVSTGHNCSSTTATGSDTYAYDDRDNRIQVVENNGATSSDRRYCYDALNQLIYRNSGAACSSGSNDEASTYDDTGNRLTAKTGGVTTNFAYTADGLLCDVETAPTVASCTGGNVTSESAGRIASYNGWTYGYDAQGRLVSACKSPTCASGFDKVTFGYDGEDHRTQIVATAAAGGVTTTDFRYQSDVVVEEFVNGSVARRFTVNEAGRIATMTIPSGGSAGTYLVTWNGHGDALGLWKENVDGSVSLANSFVYDTWGKSTLTVAGSFSDLGFRYRYVGASDVQADDSLSVGLLYMHARHQSPSLGRFLQPDPSRAETNLFAYAGGDPVTSSDPSGLLGCGQIFSAMKHIINYRLLPRAKDAIENTWGLYNYGHMKAWAQAKAPLRDWYRKWNNSCRGDDDAPRGGGQLREVEEWIALPLPKPGSRVDMLPPLLSVVVTAAVAVVIRVLWNTGGGWGWPYLAALRFGGGGQIKVY
jgi:RHS repeat-associated protein